MKKMKKVLASLLAATMVMSMSVTAWADEPNYNLNTPGDISVETTLEKLYTVTGATDDVKDILYPEETLSFTSTPDVGNPDSTANLTVVDLEVKGRSNQNLTVELPVYTKAGLYKYVITEDGVTNANLGTQGVTYTDAAITITVLVVYDYEDNYSNDLLKVKANNGNHLEVETIGVTIANGENEKNDAFTNEYKLGALTVKKEVTGNLASETQKFDIDVTLTSDQEVLSAISYGGDQTIAVNEWVKDGASNTWTVTKTISIAHGEDVTFSNIPEGVTYAVAEQQKHFVADATGSDPTIGYSAEYTDKDSTATITVSETDEVTVTNTKGTSVDTGIILDSAPYILLLAFAAMGVFAVVTKKREEEF